MSTITEFQGTDGATRANFNERIQEANAEFEAQDSNLTAHASDSIVHVTQADHDKINGAVQSATIGGATVTKSGTTLQLPAYPTALPNPNALSVSVGNGGVSGSYTGTAALSISIPKITKSTTATPGYTLAEGELYFSPN